MVDFKSECRKEASRASISKQLNSSSKYDKDFGCRSRESLMKSKTMAID